MRHRFRGKFYHVECLDTWRGRSAKNREQGYCTSPEKPNRAIVLRRKMPKRSQLANAIHEAMHACSWDLSEETVNESSIQIAAYLKKMFHITPNEDFWGPQ